MRQYAFQVVRLSREGLLCYVQAPEGFEVEPDAWMPTQLSSRSADEPVVPAVILVWKQFVEADGTPMRPGPDTRRSESVSESDRPLEPAP